MTIKDVDYYSMRERQERRHATRCTDVSVRRIHLEMAERYVEKLAAIVVPTIEVGPA